MRARLSLLGGDILCERDGGEAEAAALGVLQRRGETGEALRIRREE